MLTSKFYLKEPTSKNETLIYLVFNLKGRRLKLSTRQKIHPHLWDFQKQQCTKERKKILKLNKSYPGINQKLIAVQAKLDNISSSYNRYYANNSLQGTPEELQSLEVWFKNYFNDSKKNEVKDDSILSYLKVVIDQIERKERKKVDGDDFSSGTIKNYRNLLQALVRFEKSIGKKLLWDRIDKSIYTKFINWHEHENLSTNYCGKHIKDLQVIMRMAFEEEISTNQCYNNKWFSVPKEEVERNPLSLDEIDALIKLELPIGSLECFARDIFVVGCYSGFRISDLRQISKSCIRKSSSGKSYIQLKTIKTGQWVKIPINQKVHSLLERNDYDLSKYSDQHINKKLKIIARKAGFPEKRSQNFKMHLSRHTFCTNIYLMGIPLQYARKLSTHASEKSFRIYAKINPDDTLSAVENHKFFK